MPAIMFPDAQLAVRDRLRELLAASNQTYAQGVTVSTKPPKADAPLPYVQVRTDANTRDARLNGRATVRILVWHADEGLGVKLASLAEALLIHGGGSDRVRNVAALAGPVPVGDSETGEPLSFFSVTAYLRPIQL
jgi:hypothetical protein